LPAKTTPIAKPAAAASADPSPGRQDQDLAAAAQQPTQDFPSDSDGVPSHAERLAADRTERRRLRAVAHETPTPARAPRRARRARATKSTSAQRAPGRLTLRDSMSVNVIGVLAAGGLLGAILGALSAAGWVIGLLVAGLTVVLSAVLRSYQRST
jgi:hypothetical protein